MSIAARRYTVGKDGGIFEIDHQKRNTVHRLHGISAGCWAESTCGMYVGNDNCGRRGVRSMSVSWADADVDCEKCRAVMKERRMIPDEREHKHYPLMSPRKD